MDDWKFYDITHSDHLICNPTNEAKLEELVELVGLSNGGNVLEIAAGKGELIARLIERWAVRGVAVELSPYFSRELRQKLKERVPNADVTVIEGDGAEYRPEKPKSFDLTICLGASWIWGGYDGTLKALLEWTRPGGQVVVGEPYWRCEPSPELLENAEYDEATIHRHWGNVTVGRELGLRLTYTIDSNLDDWDRYYALWWAAADRFVRTHPDDPDIPELMERIEKQQENYLRWERNEMGWAIYVFRAPGRDRPS